MQTRNVCACMCVCVRACMHACMCACVRVCIVRARARARACMCMCAHKPKKRAYSHRPINRSCRRVGWKRALSKGPGQQANNTIVSANLIYISMASFQFKIAQLVCSLYILLCVLQTLFCSQHETENRKALYAFVRARLCRKDVWCQFWLCTCVKLV